MTKLNLTIVFALMFAVAAAFAQDSNIRPNGDDEKQPAAQAAPAATPAATPAPQLRHQTREGQEEATRRVLNNECNGNDGHDGASGRTIYVRRVMSADQLREIADKGGPAAGWAKAALGAALKRGAKNGGVDGRTKGAKITDSEWGKKVRRDEFAAGMERSAEHAESVAASKSKAAVTNHDQPNNGSHQDIRDEIASLKIQLGWIKAGVVLACIVGFIGWFLPWRRRRGNVPPAPTY